MLQLPSDAKGFLCSSLNVIECHCLQVKAEGLWTPMLEHLTVCFKFS